MARKLNGAAVREIRLLAGITQAELARRIGVNPALLCRAEQGKAPLSAVMMRKVADTLGVALDSISYPVPEPAEAAS